MKMRRIVPALGLLALGLASRSVLAQSSILLPPSDTPTDVTASLIIPASVDPDSLTIVTNGQTVTKTDNNNPITGRLLAANVPPPPIGGAGLNLFGNVRATTTSPDIPVVELDFDTTYTGGIAVDALVDPMLPGFTPWFVESIAPLPGYAQAFRAYKTLPTQAGLANDQFLAGFFSVRLTDPTDPTGFLASTFAITGFTSVQAVPEPGTWALLGGAMLTGGAFLRRKRATNSRIAIW